jgi:hypothetical protein
MRTRPKKRPTTSLKSIVSLALTTCATQTVNGFWISTSPMQYTPYNHRVNWTADTARRLPVGPRPAASYPDRSRRLASPGIATLTSSSTLSRRAWRAGTRHWTRLRFSEPQGASTLCLLRCSRVSAAIRLMKYEL